MNPDELDSLTPAKMSEEGAKMERKVSARGLSLGEALNFFYSARATSHRERCDGDEISTPYQKAENETRKKTMFQLHGPENYFYVVANKFLRYLLCLILIDVLRKKQILKIFRDF